MTCPSNACRPAAIGGKARAAGVPVFLGTCVLLKPYLCDTLLSVAEAGVYRPLWSPMVMTELERNLAQRGLDEKRITHRLDQMNAAFPTRW